jgi:hypothetical protein
LGRGLWLLLHMRVDFRLYTELKWHHREWFWCIFGVCHIPRIFNTYSCTYIPIWKFKELTTFSFSQSRDSILSTFFNLPFKFFLCLFYM